MANQIAQTGETGKTGFPSIDVIFHDHRDPLDRRTRARGGNQEAGAFVNCRRDEDRDRRGRAPLIPNGSWWLQRNYVDWESRPGSKKQAKGD